MWTEKTPSGKTRVCERFLHPMTGKWVRLTTTIDKDTRTARKGAERFLRARFDEMVDCPSSSEYLTLEELIDLYREDQKVSVKESTYQRNYFAMEAIKKMLGADVLVSRLSAPYVRSRFLQSGKSPATLNEHLARFRALIRWGYSSDLVDDKTFLDKVGNFKAPPHKEVIQDKYLEKSELKKLLEAMDQPVWRLLTEFLALSGLRIGEAIALEKADVGETIHINKAYDSVNKIVSSAKSLCSIRDVEIQPELEKCIHALKSEMAQRALLNRLGTPPLFLFTNTGEHINYYSYAKYLRETTERVLGRKLTPHALRHTHASLLMESGVAIDIISRRLGHDNSKITKEIYLHVTEKLKEKDAEIIKQTKILS